MFIANFAILFMGDYIFPKYVKKPNLNKQCRPRYMYNSSFDCIYLAAILSLQLFQLQQRTDYFFIHHENLPI